MAVGAARAGVFPPARDIRIEEFINYHHHQLPLPDDGRMVRLDMRWDHLGGDKAVLQVGVATASARDEERMPPLNLVLVIDRSGSMSGDRIAHVKEAVRELVDRLRPTDQIAIVSFNQTAQVDLSACQKADRQRIRQAIDRLEAGGSTNLHDGLMLGYAEAEKHLDRERSNRVILLSDGITNTGVVDSAQIAQESRRYNERGIDLSTIGLGNDFNRQLLRDLADAGRGLIHFVGDNEDIQKIFVQEVDSLLAPAAKKVRLRLDFGHPERLLEIYGYQPRSDGAIVEVDLDDLNCGATEVVLARVKTSGLNPTVDARLEFDDPVTGRSQCLTDSATWRPSRDGAKPLILADPDIRKNYVIARLAKSIRQGAESASEGKLDRAIKKLNSNIEFARQYFRDSQDADVDRMVQIVRSYFARDPY